MLPQMVHDRFLPCPSLLIILFILSSDSQPYRLTNAVKVSVINEEKATNLDVRYINMEE
jgi:hypothetical protein